MFSVFNQFLTVVHTTIYDNYNKNIGSMFHFVVVILPQPIVNKAEVLTRFAKFFPGF